MSLTFTRPLSKALMVSLLLGSALSTPASAAGRNSAPIRFGHEASPPSTQRAPARQQVAATTRRHSRANIFAYPDEPLPGFTESEIPHRVLSASNQNGLPYVDPIDYASYVKVGDPYTINGITYVPEEDPFYSETGVASWYGPGFHGNLTANGETYDMYDFTAAHPTLPLPCFVEVTNLQTNETVIVRVNDRGPFARGRLIDLSHAAAERISLIEPGSGDVRVRYLGPAPRADQAPPIAQPDPFDTDLFDIAYDPPAQMPTPEIVRAAVPSHYVQLSSFRDRSNADSFRQQIASLSNDANVVFANVNGTRYYRVVIGPYLSEAEARVEQQNMARLGHQGIIVENP